MSTVRSRWKARLFLGLPSILAAVLLACGLIRRFSGPVPEPPPVEPSPRNDSPPVTFRVIAEYDGADASTVRDTVTAPLEQQLLDGEGLTSLGLSSMHSESRPGRSVITLWFEPKTNPDMAQVLVQNRVSLAQPQLPDLVNLKGLTTRRGNGGSPNLWLALTSDFHPTLYLSNYARINLQEELIRIPGVRDLQMIGATADSLRIHLDAAKLEAHGLDTVDVEDCLRTTSNRPTIRSIVFRPSSRCAGRRMLFHSTSWAISSSSRRRTARASVCGTWPLLSLAQRNG